MNKTIKQKLRSGGVTLGSWMQLPNASVAEIMGKAGYDWIVVDLEHGSFNIETLVNVNRAIELGGSAPFVRLPNIDPKTIKDSLEAGARGLIFPMVESLEQLENAINWSLYPPLGIRGVGYSRANLFGKQFDEYYQASSELVFVAQIEHINAVKNLGSILTARHLDAIIVGPYDLSASMNLTAQFDHPEFIAAIESIKSQAIESNIPLGMHVVQPDSSELQSKIDEGYQFIAYSLDAVFLYQSAQIPKGVG
jgi:2-dehydro-3-deoxyglucarate aldolase